MCKVQQGRASQSAGRSSRSTLQASGLWSVSHMITIGLPIVLLMLMIPGEPQGLQAITYLGDEVLQGMGLPKEPKTSGAQKLSGKLRRASAPAQEGNSGLYDGPAFTAFDCFGDRAPTILKMPVGCRTDAGKKVYTGKERMRKVSINLYQASTTRDFTGKYCKVERSTSAWLCGTQDWTQILTPPIVGETEVMSAPRCADMFNSGFFVDTRFHRKTKVDIKGVSTFAYTARGVLRAEGTSVYCYGSRGRVGKNGDLVDNSMEFVSYRITMGEVAGRREVGGHRDAVVTDGPLNGVLIKNSKVAGSHIMLGAVTLLLDQSYFDTKCPLALIRKDLTMYIIPSPASPDAPAPSLKPGDTVYSVNGKIGNPPSSLHPYTILVTGAEDLVISLGQERKMPGSCGARRYLETSHSHVLATMDQEKEVDVELLQLDLDLLASSSHQDAKIDLLAYLMQLSVTSLNGQLAQETCLGSAPAMAGILEKASMETDDTVSRFIPAGEIIYRVKCRKRRYGADWINPRNCSELLPIRALTAARRLTGEQYYLLPQTRYTTRHQKIQDCPDLPAAFLGDDGTYYAWKEGRLQVLRPQPKEALKLDHLLLTGLPDLVGKVTAGQEIYTTEQENDMASRLDFGVYVHGDQSSTMDSTPKGNEGGSSSSTGSGSGGSSSWSRLPGIVSDMEKIKSPAATAMTWVWTKVGLPLWHLLTTVGALVGLATGVSWAWGFLAQARTLLTLGSTLQGGSMPARAIDALALTTSSTARAQRIRDLEGERLEDRVLRAQARVVSTTRALSSTSLQEH